MRSQDARDKILSAARAEFARAGYTAASTNRIVSAAGVSKGLLFAHFGTKQDLYLTLLLGELGRFVAAVAAEPLVGRDPIARFEQTIGAAFAYYNRHRIAFAVMMSAADLERPMQEKLLGRLAAAGFPDLISRAVEGADTSGVAVTREELAQALTLVLNGIKQTIAAGLRTGTSAAALERSFRAELEIMLRVLRRGIYEGGRR